MKEITAELRALIKALADDFFADKTEADINKFNLEKLRPAQIDYKEYYSMKTQLKRFIQEFSEFFEIYEKTVNGGKQIYFAPKVSPGFNAAEIGKWLQQAIAAAPGGRIADATLPRIVEKDPRIKEIYASYPGRQTQMLDYLEKLGYILHTKRASGSAVIENIPTGPVPDPEESENLRFFNSFVFTGPWATVTSELAKLSAVLDSSPKNIISESFITALLLNEIRGVNTSFGMRYVFDSGVKTSDGIRIYTVLEDNPNQAESGNVQKFALSFWGYGGLRDNPVWDEICTQTDFSSATPEFLRTNTDIIKSIEAVKVLASRFEDISIDSLLSGGYPVSSEVQELLNKYFTLYSELLQKFSAAMLPLPETVTLDTLSEAVPTGGINQSVVSEIKEYVSVICEKMKAFFAFFRIDEKASPIVCADEENMHLLLDNISEADGGASIDKFFEAFAVYSDFMNNEKRNDSCIEHFALPSNEMVSALMPAYRAANDEFDVIDRCIVSIYRKKPHIYIIDKAENEICIIDVFAENENGESKALDEVLSTPVDSQSNLSDSLSVYFPPFTELEKLFITGTKASVTEYLKANYYLFPDSEELIKNALQLPESTDLSFLACAKKLYAMQKNLRRQAEHLLLREAMTAESVSMLLDMYIEDERNADFCLLHSSIRKKFNLELKYYMHLIKLYIEADDSESLSELLTEFPELYYTSAGTLLLPYYENSGNTVALSICEKVAAHYAEDDSELTLWNKIFSSERNSAIHEIAKVLSASERNDEFIGFYKSHEELLSSNDSVRRAYFIALIESGSEEVITCVKNYFADFTYEDVLLAFKNKYEFSEAPYSDFYEMLSSINDSFKTAVIRRSTELRSYIEQSGLLTELMYTEAEISAVTKCFKANNYPMGYSMIDTAVRLYRFIGTRDGIAEKFLLMCLPDVRAAQELCKIYTSTGRTDELVSLYTDFPELSESTPENYLNLLLTTGQIEEFVRFFPQVSENIVAADLCLRYCIYANAEDAETVKEIFERIDLAEAAADSELLKELICALHKNKNYELLFAAIDQVFPILAETGTYSELCNLVTAYDNLSTSELESFCDSISNEEFSAPVLFVKKRILQSSDVPSFDDIYQIISENLTASQLCVLAFSFPEKLEDVLKLADNYADKSTIVSPVNLIIRSSASGDGVIELIRRYSGSLSAANLLDIEKSAQADAATLLEFFSDAILNRFEDTSAEAFGICSGILHRAINRVIHSDNISEINTEAVFDAAARIFKVTQESTLIYALYPLYVSDPLSQEMLAVMYFYSDEDFSADLPAPRRIYEIFAEQLEKNSPSETLAFCKRWSPFTPVVDTSTEDNDAELSDKFILELIGNCTSGELWNRCKQLSVCQDAAIYSKVLYICMELGIGTFERYVVYCLKNDLYDDAFLALKNRMESLAPDDNDIIGCHKLIYKTTLIEDINLKHNSKDTLLDILKLMLKRYMTPKGHTFEDLRALVTTAQCFNLEDELLSLDNVADIFMAERPDVGCAFAGIMMYKNKFDSACKLLSGIKEKSSVRTFLEGIAFLPENERQEKMNLLHIRDLIQLIQPMGEPPSYNSLKEYLMKKISVNDVLTAASAIYELHKMNPDDGTIYICLFIAAKYITGENNQKAKCLYLQRALYGYLKTQTYPFKDSVACIYMLTAANEYIKKKYPELIGTPDDYDNSIIKTATELYSETATSIDPLLRNEISDIADSISDLARSGSELHMSVLDSVMTGLWSNVFVRLFKMNFPLREYIHLIKLSGPSIMRSVAVAYSAMEKESSEETFAKWLTSELSTDSTLNYIENFLAPLKKTKLYHNIPEKLAAYPFDEGQVIFPECVRALLAETKYSPEERGSILTIGAYIAHHLNAATELTWVYTYLNKLANDELSARNDENSYVLFASLRYLQKNFDICIRAEARAVVTVPLQKRFIAERNQSFQRLAGLMADIPLLVEKAANGLNPHTCINICSVCLSTSRAADFPILRSKLNKNDRLLADEVYYVLCSKDSMKVKLERIAGITNDTVRMYLYFLAGESFGKATSEGSLATTYYNDLRRRLKIDTNPQSMKLLLYIRPHKSSYDLPPFENDTDAEIIFDASAEIPEFISLLDNEYREFADENSGISEIESSFGYISYSNFEKQRLRAYRIYRSSVNNNLSARQANCVRLGMAQYRYLCSLNEHSSLQADITTNLFALINYAASVKETDREFLRFVEESVNLVIKSYQHLDEATESLSANINNFSLIKKLLPSDADAASYDSILNILLSVLNINDEYSSNHEELCMQLSKLNADNSATILVANWRESYYKIKQLLANKIAELRNRPMLSCNILSETGLSSGYVFGEIKNIGTAEAFDVDIQAFFDNGNASNNYTISRILPDKSAPFKIQYSTDSDVDVLGFSINYSCKDSSGKEYMQSSAHRSLQILAEDYAVLPVEYSMSKIGNFDVITGEGLYGRRNEKRHLESLVSEDFFNYKDAVVRGLRRSGKTSLLNYLKNHIEMHCENVIPLFINCEDISIDCTYTAFASEVVKELSRAIRLNPQLNEVISPEFPAAVLAEFDKETFRAQDLDDFYIRLVNGLDGNKLFLIFDEFDAMLECIPDADALLSSLRKLINDSNIRNIVHFVFCGSDMLYKYEMDAGKLNQFFQSLNKLDVGNMPKEDMRDMLINTFALESKDCAYNLVYTEEAIDRIYHYTRGMVWYTRLLANNILTLITNERRNVVYPSDVCDVINIIAGDDYCSQLWQACGDNEKGVVGSVQSFAAQPYETVSKKKIISAIGTQMLPEEIDHSLILLTKLGILEKYGSGDSTSYGFPNELYRKYFRSIRYTLIYDIEELPVEYPEVFTMQTGQLATRKRKL